MFEGDGAGRESEGVLEVEIEEHHLSSLGAALDEAFVVDRQRDLSLGAVCWAGEEQLARI